MSRRRKKRRGNTSGRMRKTMNRRKRWNRGGLWRRVSRRRNKRRGTLVGG